MKPIEGGRQFPVTLGSRERDMLDRMAEEQERSKAAIIRILIRNEYQRRQAEKRDPRYAEQVR
jgi:hypothetical protein